MVSHRILFHRFRCISLGKFWLISCGFLIVAGLLRVDAQEDPLQLDCLYPSNSKCENVPITNCNTTCVRHSFYSGQQLGVVYSCDPPNLATQPTTDIVLNSYSTIVASDTGYCRAADSPPPPVHCFTEYLCNQDCRPATVGAICKRNGGAPGGVLVQPQHVDWETGFCPSIFCDEL